MFDFLQIQSELGISAADCLEFFASVRSGYIQDSGLHFKRHYHNFSHALDVTQTLFATFGFFGGVQLLSSLEKVVLLVASIGHDIAHPGVTNQYIVETKHPYTVSYGRTSVLESMHAATMSKLVEKHNILQNLALQNVGMQQ
uniref:PDEase domain-containing protein n=1 Tax=Globisporangium ultimum (strain ATCC 200006 / CBS 805.95 / DAOM BR144) TaxID=431595 RepID=K3WKL8_GLOUD